MNSYDAFQWLKNGQPAQKRTVTHVANDLKKIGCAVTLSDKSLKGYVVVSDSKFKTTCDTVWDLLTPCTGGYTYKRDGSEWRIDFQGTFQD